MMQKARKRFTLWLSMVKGAPRGLPGSAVCERSKGSLHIILTEAN